MGVEDAIAHRAERFGVGDDRANGERLDLDAAAGDLFDLLGPILEDLLVDRSGLPQPLQPSPPNRRSCETPGEWSWRCAPFEVSTAVAACMRCHPILRWPCLYTACEYQAYVSLTVPSIGMCRQIRQCPAVRLD
jgi:hypothetical protein